MAMHARQRSSALPVWRWVQYRVPSSGSRISKAQNPGCDRRLGDSEEPPLGAHLVTPRLGFVHHGIYVGGGNVIHCGGVPGVWPRGAVEEVPLWEFSRGRPIVIRGGEPARFTAQEVVLRARSRAGEGGYRLFTNNCEHFCEWCLRGRCRSYQIERLIRWIRPWGLMSADDPRVPG